MRLVPPDWEAGLPSNDGKFQQLHAALFHGGSFVYIPPDTAVTLPIRSFFWAGAGPAAPGAWTGSFPHSVVIIGRGSRLVYVEEYVTPERPAGAGPVFSSAVTELYLGEGARLDYLTAQDWDLQSSGFLVQRARLERNASINWVVSVLGGRYTRATADALLEGEASEALMMGLAFGEDQQRFDFHTSQIHRGLATVSDQLYKTAMRDQARLTYEGLVHIHPSAAKSNGYQANRNLLLSKRAKADSIPMLEIENNDVRCKHGSACGHLSPEEVYYLLTRGLPRPLAERLVIQGYFQPVVDRVSVPSLQRKILRGIARKIDLPVEGALPLAA